MDGLFLLRFLTRIRFHGEGLRQGFAVGGEFGGKGADEGGLLAPSAPATARSASASCSRGLDGTPNDAVHAGCCGETGEGRLKASAESLFARSPL